MKTRIKLRHFAKAGFITPAFTVEVLISGKWLPIGDDNGTKKFTTRREAEAEAEKVQRAQMEGGAL